MTQQKRPTLKEMDKLPALVNDFEAANIRRQSEIDTLQLKDTNHNSEVSLLKKEISELKAKIRQLEIKKSPFAKGVDYRLVPSDLLQDLARAVLEGDKDAQESIREDCEEKARYWPHAQQEIIKDEHGVLRFRKNELVVRLINECGGLFGLNYVDTLEASREDRAQLEQLIGYSVDGYQSLNYAIPVQGLEEIE